MNIENLDQKFEKVYQQLSSEKFLEKKGLSGELPFFISTYNPAQEIDVQTMIKRMVNRLQQNDISALEINLYDLVIDLIKGRNLLEKIFKTEQSMDKEKLFRSLQNVLDVQKYLIPAIVKKIEEEDSKTSSKKKMVIITGVGEVFPYIRSHTILNNLQNAIKDRPMIMFFPGKYDGHTLDLFGRMKDDNYYRAFNIANYSTEELR
jgi:DNA-directed RNA polymerase beta' subunit